MALFLNLLGEGCISQLAAAIGTQLTQIPSCTPVPTTPPPPLDDVTLISKPLSLRLP